MSKNRISIILFVIFSILGQQSNAQFTHQIRKLSRFLEEIRHGEVSPAPTPSSESNNSEKGPAKEGSKSRGGSGKCSPLATTCPDSDKLTSCLKYTGKGQRQVFLVIQNDGEHSLKGNFTFLPTNITTFPISLAKQEKTEVDVTAYVGGSSSIVVNAGHGECVIHISPVSRSNMFNKFPQVSQLTPLHGLYLFFIITFIMGGAWACCKFGKTGRHIDGVPYQELEMGQTDLGSPIGVETGQGWDESWDDDWDDDEIREVKSSIHEQRENMQANGNGHKFRSSGKDGWEDDWDP